jgi:hypothetical protein
LSGSTRTRRNADAVEDEDVKRVQEPGKKRANTRRAKQGRRIDRRATGDNDTPNVEAALSLIAGADPSQYLPKALADRLSRELGIDASAVRIHDDVRAHQAAANLGARAFAIGDDVFFAKGAYDPTSVDGIELIAHEVAHVAQQRNQTAASEERLSSQTDPHEQEADDFAKTFTLAPKPGDDPASVVEHARREARRVNLPFQAELEEQLGTSFDHVQAFAGPAAQAACEALGAAAFVVRNLVMLADPSPQRELLLHELKHVEQMGGNAAPPEFALGTLRVSSVDDAAEVDARSQGPTTVSADRNTIHRTPTGAPPADGAAEKETPESRIEKWVAHASSQAKTYPQTVDGKSEFAFGTITEGESQGTRYTKTSEKPWKREHYKKFVQPDPAKWLSDSTYTADIQKMLADSAKYKVATVDSSSGGESGKTYAFLFSAGTGGQPFSSEVKYIWPTARTPPNPEDQFNAYFRVAKHLTEVTKRIKGFDYADGVAKVPSNTWSITPKGADNYRDALRTVIVAAYKAAPTGWELFHKEVMQGKGPDGARLIPSKFNGLTGSIFEELVKETVGVELKPERPIFVHEDLNKNPRIGDAAAFGDKGKVIIDDKASDSGIDQLQCKDYVRITEPGDPIKGYFAPEGRDDPQHIYTAIAYAVPSQTIADKVVGQINSWFPAKAKDIWQRCHVSPDPSGLKTFLVSFNPQLRLQTKDDGASPYVFTNPVSPASGVKFKKVTINTDANGGVSGGSVDMGIDMAGAIKNDNISGKQIQPGTGPVAGGTVENKFGSGFKSTLDKVLGAVDVDAKLVDGGVEASIGVKKGAIKIPSFEVDDAKLNAKYINDNLSVEGEVGLSHKSKKIGGNVKVGWDGVSWTFDGQLKLAEGLVPGLTNATLGVRYAGNKTTIYCPSAKYQNKIGAVDLSGDVTNLEYDVKDGAFSGEVELTADMGMFGTASASGRIENNKLKSATFSYDSPQLKYPAKSEKPSLSGTVGGTINYNDGKFSGAIRGKATINVAGLKKVAGDEGLGLDVDAHMNANGTYGGTIKTTSALQFGEHIKIPSISATIHDDSSITGAFELKVHGLKWIDDVSVKCSIDKDGVTIEEFHAAKSFGSEEKNKFWGSLSVDYTKGKGLEIGGTVNYKIKEGMVATGKLKFSTETYKASLELEVSEITLLDAKVKKKTLFKAEKKIPVVNVYGVGIYIDIGFDLAFDMGFHLGLKPKLDFVDFSLKTGEFKEIKAQLELLGQLYAELTGTPKLGIGVFVLDPSLLSGGGGLKMPIVGRAEINPKGKVEVVYDPKGGVTGAAKFDMNMMFGIKAALTPYAEFDVLSGLWNPSWTGKPLTEFTILEPKELFKVSLDLGGDMTKKTDPPELPAENAAPASTGAPADSKFKQEDTPRADSTPEVDKKKQGPKEEVKESGDSGPFGLDSLLPQLRSIPGVATAEKVLKIAKKAWKFIEPIYDLVKPLIDIIGKQIDRFIDLFDTELPESLEDAIPWVWKVAKKVLNLAFGGIGDLVSAIKTMLGHAIDFAKKLINKAVQSGWIGVKRHEYYIWRPWPMDDYNFLAAAEYKINIPNVANIGTGGPDSILLSPDSAVALGLYQVLKRTADVTYRGSSGIGGEPYNDFWTGPGARG